MDTGDRKVIFGCCGGAVLLAILLVVGGWVFYKQGIEPNLPQMSPPESLEAEGPSVGADLMERAVFFEDERLGIVFDIAIADFDGEAGDEVVCAGMHGAAILREDGTLASFIEFPRQQDASYGSLAEVLDADGDGSPEFLTSSNTLMVRGPAAALLDADGAVLWRTEVDLGPLAAGDVDGDGELEFVGRGDHGLTLLETDGTVQWQHEVEGGPGSSVGMADANGDEVDEIIHLRIEQEEARVEIIGRNAEGEVVHEAAREQGWFRGGFASNFSICPWPTADGAPHSLSPASKHILLGALDGETVLRGEATGTNIIDNVWGIPFHARAGDDPLLASIAISNKFEATYLRIHDAEGTLLFERATKLTGDDPIWFGLAAWQPPGEGREVLLVGGNGKVWKYEMVER